MMIVPYKRPGQSAEKTARLIKAAKIKADVVILGVRGYYLNSMGEVGKNDRGIFDDAIFVSSPTVHVSFNANTDPSIYQLGVAVLDPGIWSYQLGIHGLSKPKDLQYEALVQADEVTVTRDGGKKDTGMFGINIHRGGEYQTTSLGCQTIYKPLWEEFIALVRGQLDTYKQKTVPYYLMEYQG